MNNVPSIITRKNFNDTTIRIDWNRFSSRLIRSPFVHFTPHAFLKHPSGDQRLRATSLSVELLHVANAFDHHQFEPRWKREIS